MTINGSLSRGYGIDTAIATTLRRIHEIDREINLELICGEVEGLIEDGFPDDIPLTVKKIQKVFGFRYALSFTLLNYVKDTDSTIIHSHHPVVTLPLLFKKGKKMVTWHGNNNLNWNDAGFGPLPKRITRKAVLDICTHMFRGLNRIVTVSDYLRNELVDRYGIPRRRVERIYWGVDMEKLQDSNEDRGYMLFVGRYVNYKNIGALVKLAHALNYPLVCVGEGVERANLEEYSKKLRAPVKFEGRVPLSELIKLYQQCSFYVTASKWEGFGLPPVEACACGKPAIVPRNTAHTELVVDSKTGLIYRDYNELMRATKSLIEEPNKRIDIGKAAREHVNQKFNLDNTAAAYLGIYRSLN